MRHKCYCTLAVQIAQRHAYYNVPNIFVPFRDCAHVSILDDNQNLILLSTSLTGIRSTAYLVGGTRPAIVYHNTDGCLSCTSHKVKGCQHRNKVLNHLGMTETEYNKARYENIDFDKDLHVITPKSFQKVPMPQYLRVPSDPLAQVYDKYCINDVDFTPNEEGLPILKLSRFKLYSNAISALSCYWMGSTLWQQDSPSKLKLEWVA